MIGRAKPAQDNAPLGLRADEAFTGKCRTAVVLDLGEGGHVAITLPGAYVIAAQERMKLQVLPGITDVQELQFTLNKARQG